MKITIFSMLTIMLLSCGGAKEIDVSQNPPAEVVSNLNMQINDIWATETLYGERFEPNGNKMPVLEIHSKEMRFAGNDGCNNLSGAIKKIDNENLIFGNIVATKMACLDMFVPSQFNNAIMETNHYKIHKLRLYLLDKDGKELMVLKKVD